MRLKASAAASEEPPEFDVVLPKTERGCSAPMRRLLFPLALLLAMLAVPATGHAYTLGVSDQQASTFTNPLFAPLKIKAARYITPYDVMDSPAARDALTSWSTPPGWPTSGSWSSSSSRTARAASAACPR